MVCIEKARERGERLRECGVYGEGMVRTMIRLLFFGAG